MTVRLIQVGAGIRGRHWLNFVRGHADFQCVAVVEPDAEAARQASAILGSVVPTFADLDSALSVGADAALVVSPSSTHAEVASRCIDAGLHVMVEKPLATTVAEGAQLLRHAQAAGRHVIVAENYRFWPAERTIRRLLQQQFLGAIDNATMIDRRHQPASSEGPWIAKIQYPQLQEIATHHLDSLRGFFGQRPDGIILRAWNPPGSDFCHGAHTEALVDFGQVHVQYLGTMLSSRYEFSLRIEGQRGTLWTNRKLVTFRPAGSRWYRPIRNDKVPAGDEKSYPQGGTTSLLNSLRDAVRHSQPAETRGEDNIWTVALVEAGKLSDQQSRKVTVKEVYPDPVPDPVHSS
ncbi:MAG: Gfo/Idh/MocA family protein [Steroidobacteraceae bacterium]